MILSPFLLSFLSVAMMRVQSMGTGHREGQSPDSVHRAPSGSTARLKDDLGWPSVAGAGGLAISTQIQIKEGRTTAWGWSWGGNLSIKGEVQGPLPGSPAQSFSVSGIELMNSPSIPGGCNWWPGPALWRKPTILCSLYPSAKAEGSQQERKRLGLGTGSGGSVPPSSEGEAGELRL